MLILSVVVAHIIEMAIKAPMPTTSSPTRQLLFGSEQGILLTRSAVFSIYALGASVGKLRQKHLPVTRATLREPFSVQAFIVCPFLILLPAGGLVARTNVGPLQQIGLLVCADSIAWYIFARAAAYHAMYGGGWVQPFISVVAGSS